MQIDGDRAVGVWCVDAGTVDGVTETRLLHITSTINLSRVANGMD